MNISRLSPTVFAVLLVLTWSNPAAAYIDGGTGSLLFQAAVSGLLGALFVIRSHWTNWVARRSKVATAHRNEPRA